MPSIRRLSPILVAAGLAVGCGTDSRAEPDGADRPAARRGPRKPNGRGPEPAAGGGPPRDACADLRIERTEHLAGAARVAAKDGNDWKPAFEGGPATEAELSEPYFAVEDPQGRVYVADKNAHAVRRIDPDGTIHTHAGTNARGDGPDGPTPPRTVALARPNGLFLAADGALFVLDLDNGKVRRIAPEGGSMETVLRADTDFGKGRGLWVRDGTIFVAAGTRVVQGPMGGTARTAWDGFVSLGNLLGEPDGSLLAADRGGDRVFRLSPGKPPVPFLGSGRNGPLPPGPVPAGEVPADGPRSVVRLAPDLHLIAEHEGGRILCVVAGRARAIFDRADPDAFVAAHDGPPIGPMRGLSRAPDGSLLLVHGDAGAVHRLHPTRPGR